MLHLVVSSNKFLSNSSIPAMKRMSCLPLLSSAPCQPIGGQLAIAGLLMGEWANHRPGVAGLTAGAVNRFFVAQFSIAQYGQLIRDQIILPIQSGRCREILC